MSYKWKYIKMKLCDFKDHKVPIEKNTWICGAIFIVRVIFSEKNPHIIGGKKRLQHMASFVDSVSIWCCMYVHMDGFNCGKDQAAAKQHTGKGLDPTSVRLYAQKLLEERAGTEITGVNTATPVTAL